MAAQTTPIGGKPMEFFTTDNCPYAQRAWIALLEKEEDPSHPKLFNTRIVNYFNLDLPTTREFYLVHNTVPAGVLPDGTHLKESLPMVYWADETYPQRNPLGSKDEKVKAAIAKYTSGQFDVCSQLWKALIAPTDEARKANLEQLFKAYAEISKDVKASGGPFLTGSQFSAADIAIYPFVERAKIYFPTYRNISLPSGAEYDGFVSWLSAVESRPSVKISSADRTDESMKTLPFAAKGRADYLNESAKGMIKGVKEQVRRQLRFAPAGVDSVNIEKALEAKREEEAATARVKAGHGTASDLTQYWLDNHFNKKVDEWQHVFSDNIRWEIAYSESAGLPPSFDGKAAWQQLVATVQAKFADQRFHNVRISRISDNEAVATFHVLAKTTEGKEFRSEFVVFLRSDNGKVVYAREYFDPLAVKQ